MATGLLHFRVDDRMLHGVVATQWVPEFKATRAMVIDEAASKSDIVRSGLKMACPAGVALSVLAPAKAVENIKSGKYNAQRVVVVFRYIADAYEVFKMGVEIPQLNLGNVTQNKGETTVLDKTVRVSPEEKRMLREMRDAGVKITVRFRLSDPEVDVAQLLD